MIRRHQPLGNFNPSALAADDSDYATGTAGYDPNLQTASKFRGVPVHVQNSADDTLVPPAANTKKLTAKIEAFSPVTASAATGNMGISHTTLWIRSTRS